MPPHTAFRFSCARSARLRWISIVGNAFRLPSQPIHQPTHTQILILLLCRAIVFLRVWIFWLQPLSRNTYILLTSECYTCHFVQVRCSCFYHRKMVISQSQMCIINALVPYFYRACYVNVCVLFFHWHWLRTKLQIELKRLAAMLCSRFSQSISVTMINFMFDTLNLYIHTQTHNIVVKMKPKFSVFTPSPWLPLPCGAQTLTRHSLSLHFGLYQWRARA